MAPLCYKYTPLSPDTDQIRLLTLLPATDENAEIVISLRNSRTEEAALQYEALSYVWGSSGNAAPISVITSAPTVVEEDSDEVSCSAYRAAALYVTENLASALRHLRQQDTPRTLWIDAICIDQQNLAERSEQVGKMGRIYSSAARVVVWLGPASPDSDLAMGLVDHMGQVLRFDHPSKTFTLTSNGVAEPHWADLTQLLSCEEAELRALENLFKRPWFERLWVVQEVLTNPNAIVVCGGQETAWQSIMVSVRCLLGKGTETRGADAFWSRLSQIDTVFGDNIHRRLVDMMSRTWALKCDDDRDRVYALLSLAEDGDNIYPDYSLNTIQVFRELVVHLIKQSKSDFLAYCELGSRMLTGPSWIPDWTAKKMARPIVECNAAYFALQPIVESPSYGAIRVAAVPVGTVVDIDIVTIPSLDSILIMREILRLLPADVESSTYKTGCSLMEACSGTLVCWSFATQVPRNRNELTLQKGLNSIRACLRWGNGADFEDTWDNRTYLGNVYAFTKNRALIRTKEGYIGLAPSDVKVGDTIFAVLSCHSFIVLRPTGGNEGRYNVVGEAFLYGLDNAQALLGPFPEHIRAEQHYRPEKRSFFDAYRDTRTGEVSWIDPRLEALGIVTETDADGIPLDISADKLENAGIHLSQIELV